MASTPMDIDSPIGANGLGGKVNGIPSASTTAKLTEMMPLYRPTKVSITFQRNRQPLTDARSCFVASPRRRQANRPLAQALFCLSILTMKGDCFSPRKVITVCKSTISKRESITRLFSVKNMVLCLQCSLMLLAPSFTLVPKSTVGRTELLLHE